MLRLCSGSLKAISVLFFLTTISLAAQLSESRKKYEEAKNLIHEYSGKGNNYEVAYGYATSIYSENPEDPYAYLIVAELQSREFKDYKTGSEKEVLSLTERVLSLDNSIAGAYVINAKLANIRRDLPEAEENLNKALSLEPENREASYEMALLEQYRGNYEKARDWYEKTISLHTSLDRKSNIYFWLGKLHLGNGRVEEARLAMQKGIDLAPTAPWKLVNFSLFLSRNTTDYAQAEKYARLALDQMEFKMARRALGMALYAMWAEKYKNLDNQGVAELSREAEMKLLADIEQQSGMPIGRIVPVALSEMPRSSIFKAVTLMELH